MDINIWEWKNFRECYGILILAMVMLSCKRPDCLAMDSVPLTFFFGGFDFLLAVMSP